MTNLKKTQELKWQFTPHKQISFCGPLVNSPPPPSATTSGCPPPAVVLHRRICILLMDESIQNEQQRLTLVTRKACFGLPTACPSCLPVYIYLKLAKVPFDLSYNLSFPDSDQIPYVDADTYVAYNNEKGGVIESLKEDNIVNLDSEVQNLPEWVSALAMINSWLSDAILYELWVASDGSSAHKIYYSDLPWPIGKLLYLKQVYNVKQLLGISKDNAERREEEIYRRATMAYKALPTSLDAIFLGHALITLYALPETSVLRGKLLEQANLVLYADKHKAELLDAASSSSSDPSSSSSSSVPRRGPSNWSKFLSSTNSYFILFLPIYYKNELLCFISGFHIILKGSHILNLGSKPKSQPKRERTQEEKIFRRKAKYFLITQMVAVLVFLSLLGGSEDTEVDDADGDEGFDYE
uniref:Thioredoxin-like fold domain-containing protein n=1 Tax=Helianthus annuus TaxID=4232 RepID=A0A251TKA0_HELAN